MATIDLSDIESYLATFSVEDRLELAYADLALDLVVLAQGVADGDTTWLEGLRPAIARLDQAGSQLDLATLETYLNELGYAFRLMSIEPVASARSTEKVVR